MVLVVNLFLAVDVIVGKEGGVTGIVVVVLDGSAGMAVVLNILGFGLIVVVMYFGGAAVGILVIGGNVISLDGDCDGNGGSVVGIYGGYVGFIIGALVCN